jgi:hypothetical protein
MLYLTLPTNQNRRQSNVGEKQVKLHLRLYQDQRKERPMKIFSDCFGAYYNEWFRKSLEQYLDQSYSSSTQHADTSKSGGNSHHC